MRVVGAVLAGGAGRRLGGGKATVELQGRPLAAHAVGALRAVAAEVVVVAKPDTPLPALDVPVWHDDTADLHPRHGLVRALRGARGATVLALAVDLPLVEPGVLRALLADGGVALARAGGRPQPLCAAYPAAALAVLAGAPPGEPLTATVARLAPAFVDVPERVLLNVNRPEDLRVAEAARQAVLSGGATSSKPA